MTIADLKENKEEIIWAIKLDGFEKFTKEIMTKMVELCADFDNVDDLLDEACSYFDKYSHLTETHYEMLRKGTMANLSSSMRK